MAQEKDNKSSLKDLIRNPLFWGMLVSLVGLIGTNVKDIFLNGTEVKHRSIVVNIVLTDSQVKQYIDDNFKQNLNKALGDPMLWYNALASDFVKDFTHDKIASIRTEMNDQFAKMDSIQKAKLDNIMKISGFRNEEYEQILGDMMRWFVKNKLETVHASF